MYQKYFYRTLCPESFFVSDKLLLRSDFNSPLDPTSFRRGKCLKKYRGGGINPPKTPYDRPNRFRLFNYNSGLSALRRMSVVFNIFSKILLLSFLTAFSLPDISDHDTGRFSSIIFYYNRLYIFISSTYLDYVPLLNG